jgi:hypothetical protein
MATGNYSYWKNCLTMIRAGTGITVDNSDPMKPIINATGGGGGGIESIVAGDNITVDDTDPLNPIINAGGGLPKVCLVEVYTDPEDSEITYLTILYNNTGRTPSTDAYGNVLLSGAYVNYFVSGCRSDDDVVMGTEYNKYTLDWGSGLMCTANPMPTNYLTPITIKFEIYE